jgi:cation-transporting ATPase I
MTAPTPAPPRLVHAVPGRVRIHVAAWPAGGAAEIDKAVRRLAGVSGVKANSLTQNVLIRFDPKVTDAAALLMALGTIGPTATEATASPLPPVVDEEKQGGLRRARIAVRGLDRDPRLAKRVVERLRRFFGVRARASVLTGRVVVDYDEGRVDLSELLAHIAAVELPDLPGEDRPAHPLDQAPLWAGVGRTIGAAIGLGTLLIRRLLGRLGPRPGVKMAATVAGGIGLLRSFPGLRSGLRQLLGRHVADLAFGLASVVSLSLARGFLGLAVVGVEGALLWSEVRARRAAWRRYEASLHGAADAEPDAVIRLGPGETTPLPAQVIEGTGTAVGRDGLPRPCAPGTHLSAGARLLGGPVVLQLEGGEPFEPRPRPVPVNPSFYSRYLHAVGPLAVGYAALTGLLTRSLARAFEALLLVNPRPAIIGMEAANLAAAHRVLHQGVIVVGSRPRRAVRLPDVLLLDGPRLLTDGLEVADVLSLGEGRSEEEIRALAGSVAAASGCPWGGAFLQERGGDIAGRAGGVAPLMATEGSFNGLWASAVVDGVGYLLGPPEDEPELPAALELLHEGGYLLALSLDVGLTLGYIALRPRLGPGVEELVQTCRQLGVELELLSAGNRRAAEAVARRAGVPLVGDGDAVALVHSRQQAGKFVAVVSDSAHAASAFADCDLALGLLWQQASRFPARADLLARDLSGVAAVLQAGARREQAVRDGVLLSALANGVGALVGLGGSPGVERASRGVYLAALGALADTWFRLLGGRN